MAKNGKDILVYWNGAAIAAVKNTEIQSTAEMMAVNKPILPSIPAGATAAQIAAAEAAAAQQAKYNQFVPGRVGWSVSVGYLVMRTDSVRDLLKVGQLYTLKVKDSAGTDEQGVTGTAYLQTCKISATIGNLVQGSFQFVGTGPLT